MTQSVLCLDNSGTGGFCLFYFVSYVRMCTSRVLYFKKYCIATFFLKLGSESNHQNTGNKQTKQGILRQGSQLPPKGS